MSNCTQVELWLVAQETDTLRPDEDAALKDHLRESSVCRVLAGLGEREGFDNIEIVAEDRYRIGNWQNGRPFYAMTRIRRSLHVHPLIKPSRYVHQ